MIPHAPALYSFPYAQAKSERPAGSCQGLFLEIGTGNGRGTGVENPTHVKQRGRIFVDSVSDTRQHRGGSDDQSEDGAPGGRPL